LAVARPIPLLPPVMTATFPANLFIWILLLGFSFVFPELFNTVAMLERSVKN
jgi:hypothetical protein